MGMEVTFYDLPAVEVDFPGSQYMGMTGNQGEPGKNGATYVPAVDQNGVLTWENDQGLPNPEGVDMKALLQPVIAEQLPLAVAAYLVQHPVAGGLTQTEKNLILNLLRNAAYISGNMGTTLNQLEAIWNGNGGDVHTHNYTSSITTVATCTTPGVRTYTCSCGQSYIENIPASGHKFLDGVCTVCDAADPNYKPDVNLTSISATYSGGEVVVGTSVHTLRGVTVTAYYSDGTSGNVAGYTLSGTVAEGNNIITVSYNGKTTTFTVTGVAAPVTLTKISAVYNGGSVPEGTALTDLTGITVTAHYSDGSTETVTGYTMSGTIAEGNNTITVSHGGKTTTFAVMGFAKNTAVVNLFDKNTMVVNGKAVDNNGNILSYATSKMAKIPIVAGTTYAVSKTGNVWTNYQVGRVLFVDDSETVVDNLTFGAPSSVTPEAGVYYPPHALSSAESKGVSGVNGLVTAYPDENLRGFTFESPVGATYILFTLCFYGGIDSTDTLMFEEGDTCHDYVAYV